MPQMYSQHSWLDQILSGPPTYKVTPASSTVTISIASPGVISWTAHGLQVGDQVVFGTTGALPTGLTPGVIYFIISAGFGANSFEISASPGGAAVNTSGTQSGTHTAYDWASAIAIAQATSVTQAGTALIASWMNNIEGGINNLDILLNAQQSVSANTTLVDRSGYAVFDDTTAGAHTITLPAAPSTGSSFDVIDSTQQWPTHNLTVNPNGKNINGVSGNITVGVSGMLVFYYNGTQWNLTFVPSWPPNPLSYRFIKRVIITNPTTAYTPSANAKLIRVSCYGGGGSGGGGSSVAASTGVGSCGGGGAKSIKDILVTKTSYTVAVGLGGLAPAAGANNGNPGGDTTFDSPSVCTAKGGLGGTGQVASTTTAYLQGGAGGAAASGLGDITIDGNSGDPSFRRSGTDGWVGSGGAGPDGGRPPATIAQGNGAAGKTPGAGGSGGESINGGAATAGGAGANGQIIIEEYGY